MTSNAEALHWRFVTNLGIAYGAGLYEKRVVLPMWFISSRMTPGTPGGLLRQQ